MLSKVVSFELLPRKDFDFFIIKETTSDYTVTDDL